MRDVLPLCAIVKALDPPTLPLMMSEAILSLYYPFYHTHVHKHFDLGSTVSEKQEPMITLQVKRHPSLYSYMYTTVLSCTPSNFVHS